MVEVYFHNLHWGLRSGLFLFKHSSKHRGTLSNQSIATHQSNFWDRVGSVAEGRTLTSSEKNKQQVHQRGINDTAPKTGMVFQVEATEMFSPLLNSSLTFYCCRNQNLCWYQGAAPGRYRGCTSGPTPPGRHISTSALPDPQQTTGVGVSKPSNQKQKLHEDLTSSSGRCAHCRALKSSVGICRITGVVKLSINESRPQMWTGLEMLCRRLCCLQHHPAWLVWWVSNGLGRDTRLHQIRSGVGKLWPGCHMQPVNFFDLARQIWRND